MFEMSMEDVEVTALSMASGLSLLAAASRLSPRDAPGGGGGAGDNDAIFAIPRGIVGPTFSTSSASSLQPPPPPILLGAHGYNTSSSVTSTGALVIEANGASIGTVASMSSSIHPPTEEGGLGWSVGVTSLQGIRNHQEDQYTAIADLNAVYQLDYPEAQAFYAIYDGHCGVRAARYAKVCTRPSIYVHMCVCLLLSIPFSYSPTYIRHTGFVP